MVSARTRTEAGSISSILGGRAKRGHTRRAPSPRGGASGHEAPVSWSEALADVHRTAVVWPYPDLAKTLLDADADRRSNERSLVYNHIRNASVRLERDDRVTRSSGGPAILEIVPGQTERSRRRTAVEAAIGQLLGGLSDCRCRCRCCRRLGSRRPAAHERGSHDEPVWQSHSRRIQDGNAGHAGGRCRAARSEAEVSSLPSTRPSRSTIRGEPWSGGLA